MENPIKIFIKTLTLAVLFIIGTNAQAAIIQIDFDGQISFGGSFLDPTGLFSQGDALSGFWLVDTNTVDSDVDTSRGQYDQSGTPAFQMNIGGHSFLTTTTTVQILDNYVAGIGTLDAYDVLGGSATSSIAGLSVNQMQITLRDLLVPLDVFSSDALPGGAPNPSDFDQFGQVQGQLTGTYSGNDFFMNLEINSTSIAEVPAPSIIALFGAGLFGLGLVRRRQS